MIPCLGRGAAYWFARAAAAAFGLLLVGGNLEASPPTPWSAAGVSGGGGEPLCARVVEVEAVELSRLTPAGSRPCSGPEEPEPDADAEPDSQPEESELEPGVG